MLRFHTFITIVYMLALQGCMRETVSNKEVDWSEINYVEIVCGKGKTTNPGCKSKDEDISAIGGSGKGK